MKIAHILPHQNMFKKTYCKKEKENNANLKTETSDFMTKMAIV